MFAKWVDFVRDAPHVVGQEITRSRKTPIFVERPPRAMATMVHVQSYVLAAIFSSMVEKWRDGWGLEYVTKGALHPGKN